MGCTPKGWPWCSIARVKGRFGRRASFGQRARRRVYCFAILKWNDELWARDSVGGRFTYCCCHGCVRVCQ